MNEIQSLGGRASTTLPNVWVGYIIAAAFLVVEIGEAIIDPTAVDRVTLLPVLIALGGWIYWMFCVYRMHKVIAEATNSSHPITPGKAVGYHFIPLYNLYWVFKWTNEITNFVNSRSSSKQMAKDWAGFFLFIGFLLRIVDVAIALAVIFSVGIYLTRRISSAIESSPSPNVV